MKKALGIFLLSVMLLTACGQNGFAAASSITATPLPTIPPIPTETPSPIPTETPAPTPTPAYPPEGMGPTGFPVDVDPLTGLKVEDPALLERRPLAIKVANLPRDYRPQWGLSLSDIVFEYYTEQGSTRFIALFLGKNADMVGPIRSARFFDGNIMRMYKSVLAFGSGDERVRYRLFNSEYFAQLVSEYPAKCPPMCRYEPNGVNYLTTNTADLSAYAKNNGIDNGRQNLDGMFFKLEAPGGGQSATSFIARFSSAIFNKWDYDAASGKYARSSEKDNDTSGGLNETYVALTDRLTNEAIAADNVVVILTPYEYYLRVPEMMDVPFSGSGVAYAFRDGQMYQVQWNRPTANSVLSLTTQDGQPFPFKPGNTWFEVMGSSSKAEQKDNNWRFTFNTP